MCVFFFFLFFFFFFFGGGGGGGGGSRATGLLGGVRGHKKIPSPYLYIADILSIFIFFRHLLARRNRPGQRIPLGVGYEPETNNN